MSMSPSESDFGGSHACDAGMSAARERAVQAIHALMEVDPEGWPEHLAAVAGIACKQDCQSLDLLADAAVQVAAKAYKQRRDEGHETAPSVN